MGSEDSMLHSVDYIPFIGLFVHALPTVAARKQIYPIFQFALERGVAVCQSSGIKSRQKFLENFNMNAKPTSSFVLWLPPAWKTYSFPGGSAAVFSPSG